MSGILNKKSRIIDFVITENGRSQIQNGDIRYKYATISDKSIIYTKDHDLSKLKKSDVSKAEIDYIPLETNTKVNDLINPEFDIKEYFLNNNNVISRNTKNISFDDKVEEYFTNFSLGQNLKNLKYLTTKSFVNNSVDIKFIDNGFLNNTLNFNNVNTYDTVRETKLNKEDLKTIALDKRFSHKKNFMLMPPINNDGIEIYERENFKNIDDLDEENSVGFLLTSYKSLDTSNFQSREEEILSLVRSLNNNQNIQKKVYEVEKISDFNGLLFEMHEKDDNSETLQKLHFIKIGKFYDKSTLTVKKVYLVGKIINTRDDASDLDVLFNFNNGQVNLEGNNTFALSAYFSFICMFTIVIE